MTSWSIGWGEEPRRLSLHRHCHRFHRSVRRSGDPDMILGMETPGKDDASPPDRPVIDKHARMPVGVIVERRKAKNPWQDYTWHVLEAVVGAPALEPWSVMRADEDRTRFFAGTYEIELHPRETENYRYNLTGPEPSIYVVLRFDVADAPHGVAVQLVTASHADAQAYMESFADQVERIPIPPAVAEWLAAYVEAYHVDRPFHKRQLRRFDPNMVQGQRKR